MKRLHLIMLMSLMSFITMAQNKPTESQAYKKIKEYKYAEFISKDAGIPLSQVKIEKKMVGDGSSNMEIGKTTIAEENYWPMDEIVFFYVFKAPKDKDGIVRTYDFTVKYRRSQCNNGICVLLDDWQFVSAVKYGPRIDGAKPAPGEQIEEMITERLRYNKQMFFDELSGYDFENWIEISSVTYPEAEDYYSKQADITANQKKCHIYITGYLAVPSYGDPTKYDQIVKVKRTVKVFLKREGSDWKFDYIEGFGGSPERLEEIEPTEDDYYYTFSEVSFDEIFNKRQSKKKALKSCSEHNKAGEAYIMALQNWSTAPDILKAFYSKEADFEKDLKLLNYLSENGMEIVIEQGEIRCKDIGYDYFVKGNVILKISKMKGKLYKELKSYEMVGNGLYYLQNKGKESFSIDIDLEIDGYSWKVQKSWAYQILKKFE